MEESGLPTLGVVGGPSRIRDASIDAGEGSWHLSRPLTIAVGVIRSVLSAFQTLQRRATRSEPEIGGCLSRGASLKGEPSETTGLKHRESLAGVSAGNNSEVRVSLIAGKTV